MPTYTGVIETSSGDLLRCGFSDFTINSATEELRTDVPFPGKRKNNSSHSTFHRWTGSAWIEVSNTPALSPLESLQVQLNALEARVDALENP